MNYLILLLLLSIIGIIETAYLIRKRLAHENPVCPIGGDCAAVLTSDYNKLFFIHNDVLGLLFYIASSFLLAFLMTGTGPAEIWNLILNISVAGGCAMSLVLTYLQWRVVRAWCFWCMASALITWLMGIVILTNYLM